MEILSMQFLMALGTIVLMDLLLGGDNAVVIAMAANKLPENLRKKGILIGTAGAVIIRLVMTLAADHPVPAGNRRSDSLADCREAARAGEEG